VDELERWLVPLGLVQLAPALRANDVDLKILPELSEAAWRSSVSRLASARSC
jgi:hypothetical protein